jgi:transcriptional regulator with XRE-family HTH domain
LAQSTNIYQRARDGAGITQERAAELIGISVESIKAYEGDRRIPPDSVVVSMIDVCNAPFLGQQHLRKASEIGRDIIPEVSEKQLAEAVCAFFASIPDLDKMRSQLISIAADGKIAPDEREPFDTIMDGLGHMVKSIFDLRYHKAKTM